MYKIIFIVLVLFFLSFTEAYSQNIPKEKTAKIDTVQKYFSNPLLNKVKQETFFPNKFPLIYNNSYNTNLDSLKLNPKIKLSNMKIVPNPLANFNKNLHSYFSYYSKNLPDYNLGVVGKYFSYLKNMFALYLAILSVM